MQRIVVQPSLAIKKENFELGFATRVSGVNIKPWELNGRSSGYDWFFEPVVVTKVGIRNMKVLFQLGFSMNMTGGTSESDFYPSHSSTNTYSEDRFKSAFSIYALSWQLSFGGKMPSQPVQLLTVKSLCYY
ncbi:MAG TPA: hypothetical protein VIH57_10295, partial [Bacteroidales bacterium]